MTSEATIPGRPIFVATAVVVVLIAGGMGLLVGASGQKRGMTMDLLGVVAIPMTPISVATVGVVVTVTVLVALFGLVSVASRYDETGAEN